MRHGLHRPDRCCIKCHVQNLAAPDIGWHAGPPRRWGERVGLERQRRIYYLRYISEEVRGEPKRD
jgi:hypothetical protein